MNERRGVKGQFRHLAVVFVAALSLFGFAHFCYEVAQASTSPPLAQGHNPVACGREDDRDRPEDKVACECYHEQDPCDKNRPETRACSSFCDKSKCGCCQI